MQQHIDGVHQQLTKVFGQQQRALESDNRINAAADERLAEVERMLAELRPKTIEDHQAADEYMALVQERGHLINALQNTRPQS